MDGTGANGMGLALYVPTASVFGSLGVEPKVGRLWAMHSYVLVASLHIVNRCIGRKINHVQYHKSLKHV
jgi:hypothetical protein